MKIVCVHQGESNPQPLSMYTNTQAISQQAGLAK